jgi:hypothetical protein
MVMYHKMMCLHAIFEVSSTGTQLLHTFYTAYFLHSILSTQHSCTWLQGQYAVMAPVLHKLRNRTLQMLCGVARLHHTCRTMRWKSCAS